MNISRFKNFSFFRNKIKFYYERLKIQYILKFIDLNTLKIKFNKSKLKTLTSTLKKWAFIMCYIVKFFNRVFESLNWYIICFFINTWTWYITIKILVITYLDEDLYLQQNTSKTCIKHKINHFRLISRWKNHIWIRSK